MNGPTSIQLHEVAPRDGLQNEKVVLATETKMELLRRLAAARPASLEVGSFVRPDLVPQMADTPELCERLDQQEWVAEARAAGLRLAGLVPNRRGYDRILETSLEEITMLVSSTEGHSRANVGKGVADALAESCGLIADAKQAGRFSRLYISMAFRCPIEGRTDPKQVLEIVAALTEAGADRILLADTLGVAEADDVASLVEAALELCPVERLGLHMHDTYGKAVENCKVAWQRGVFHFDAAAGGTGGCPFAPGAKGNLASEALLSALSAWPSSCSTDLAQVQQTALWLQGELARAEPSLGH